MSAGEVRKPDEVDPEYRQWLVVAEQKAQSDYDKTVLTLSGGALGVSFAFVKDIVGENPIHDSSWLVLAWVLWALSTSAMLGSFFVSRLALRKAILQCDDGTIFCKPPGGFFTVLTRWLNGSGAILFLLGVCFMAAFVQANISDREIANDSKKATKPATHQPASAAAEAAGTKG